MPADLRLPKRAIAVVTSLLLIGGAAGVGAGAASATTGPPSPGAAALSPGLHVTVVDSSITLSNSSGFSGFSAGQFGFIQSTITPPVVVPHAPTVSFTPPPVFQSSPLQSAAQQAAQPAADASARAAALALQASAAKAAADARAQDAENASEQATAAGTQKEAAWTANLLAQQRAADALLALSAAQAAVVGVPAGDAAAAAAAAAAVQAASAALAAATQESEAAAQTLAMTSVAADAAHAAETAAAQLAETALTQSDEAGQALEDATVIARALLADTVPAIPAGLPTPTVPPVGTVPPVSAGQYMILAAAGFAPSTRVAFGIYSTPLSVVPVGVDAQGFAVAPFQIPSSFTGNHSLVAVGTGANGLQRILRIDIVVQAAAMAAVSSATLADTGVDLVVPLGGGLVALLLGTVLFALVRRRRAA
jgi:hypothetical protein